MLRVGTNQPLEVRHGLGVPLKTDRKDRNDRAGYLVTRKFPQPDFGPLMNSFPAVSLMRKYDRREEGMVCAVHLLFKELDEGNAYADIADLLRLISQTKGELSLNWRVLMGHSRLLKRELVCVEPFLERSHTDRRGLPQRLGRELHVGLRRSNPGPRG